MLCQSWNRPLIDGILDDSIRGRYTLKKYEIVNEETVSFIIRTAMMIDKGSYYSFTELNGFDLLFPFAYQVSKEHILTDGRFTTTSFAGEMTIALKE